MTDRADDWLNWEIENWKVKRKFKADDLTLKRQLKPAEQLTKDDVLGARHHVNGVYCKVCEKEWNRGGITVCAECIEYYCDDHRYRHPDCINGR